MSEQTYEKLPTVVAEYSDGTVQMSDGLMYDRQGVCLREVAERDGPVEFYSDGTFLMPDGLIVNQLGEQQ